MKKFNINDLYLFLIFALVTSCYSDTFVEIEKDNTTLLDLNYSIESHKLRTIIATPEEQKIKDVVFLFYDTKNESFVTHAIAYPKTGNKQISFKLPSEIKNKHGETYKVIILGNISEYLSNSKSIDQYVFQNRYFSYREMLKEAISRPVTGSRIITPLPFSGVLLSMNNNESDFIVPEKENNSIPLSVHFTRSVARFDLFNLDANNLIIDWAKVCNYREQGYFYNSDVPASAYVIEGTNTNSIGEVTGSDVTDGKQAFNNGGLYAYPNMVPVVKQDDELTTCLLIKGYYQTPGATEINRTQPSYYRINIALDGRRQAIRRNQLYTIVITKVNREGAETESEAMRAADPKLDYNIKENWEDETDVIVTDELGNYIMLSRTLVTLDSSQGDVQEIKVSTKNNMKWSFKWKPNGQDGSKAFDIDLRNNYSLIISSKTENKDVLNKQGTLIIDLDKTQLSMELNIVQLASQYQESVLIVDGKTGNISITVPKQGAVLSLPVITGDKGEWITQPNGQFTTMAEDYVSTGINKENLIIKFKPNTTKQELKGELIVSRKEFNPIIEDVIITFTQQPNENIISVYPNYSQNGLIIDAFSTSRSNQNGLAYTKMFKVNLRDSEHYSFEVKTTFDKDADAFAFTTTNNELKTKLLERKSFYGPTSGQIIEPKYYGKNGAEVYLCVYRTGPGDPDINGSIIFTAIPNEETTGLYKQELSIPITIKTNANSGDVIVANYFVTDRNYGTPPKSEIPISTNYNFNTEHIDNANKRFLGELVEANDPQLSTICEHFKKENYKDNELTNVSLVLPDEEFVDLLWTNYYISKQRVFLISDKRSASGSYLGTYIPYMRQHYWGQVYDNRRLYYNFFAIDGSTTGQVITKNSHSLNQKQKYSYIRCVGKLKESTKQGIS